MKRKNILIVTQWSFNDALIQAYTLPYVKIIAKKVPNSSKIFLVTFEQSHIALKGEQKIKMERELAKENIFLISFNYSRFGIVAIMKWIAVMFYLTASIITKKIGVIHAWCTPAGSLGYILSLLTNRPLIIDSYEPHAEAMVENNTWSREGMKFRILFYFEKKLSRHAEVIISATEGMREYAFRKYNVSFDKFYVKPACVDLEKFNPSRRKQKSLLQQLNLENKIVCVYAGKFGGIYLTEEVFRLFHFAEKKWGDKFRALILTSYDRNDLISWAVKNNFDPDKMIIKFVAHDQISDYMGLADFALTPVKPIPTKRYCTPIKDGEYWGLGLPIVITKNISDDSDIIKENNAGVVIETLEDAGYQKSIDKIEKLISFPQPDKINSVARRYRSFDIAQRIYSEIYSG